MNIVTRSAEKTGRDQRRRLLELAMRVFRSEGPDLRPRVATVRQGELQVFEIEPTWFIRGLVQAASVLTRSVGPDDLVMALSPGAKGKRLDSTEWGAVADLRSRASGADGGGELVMLGARPTAGGVAYWQRPLPMSLVAQLGDWTAADYEVEPSIEMTLAARAFPGAPQLPMVRLT